MLIQGEQL